MTEKRAECRTCLFRREGVLIVDPFQCRRYPPTMHHRDGYPKTEWPLVNPNDWCGEYRSGGESR